MPTGGPGPHVMPCDSLLGDPVVNRGDEELGTIAHVVLDVASGRIAYAVLAHGGVLGIGEKLVAVPWHALVLDAVRHRFILDVPRERVESAVGVDRDHWPAGVDPAWHETESNFSRRSSTNRTTRTRMQ